MSSLPATATPTTLPRERLLMQQATSQPMSATHNEHTKNTQGTPASHQAKSQPTLATHATSATHDTETLPLPSSSAVSLRRPRAAGEGGTERQGQGERERGARGHGEGWHGEGGRGMPAHTPSVLQVQSSKYLTNTGVRLD